jgi:hypothetical protein
MKEEEWRDYLTLGYIAGQSVGGAAARYALSDIIGVRETYSANPGGDTLGQFAFALDSSKCGATLMGQCSCGCNLIPWGICCNMQCYISSACISAGSGCCACSFCLGGASALYVALGSIGGCGATLFRRIC